MRRMRRRNEPVTMEAREGEQQRRERRRRRASRTTSQSDDPPIYGIATVRAISVFPALGSVEFRSSTTGRASSLDSWPVPGATPDAGGSFVRGQVAQLVEQRTENPRVGGSIPSLATQGKSLEELKNDRSDGHLPGWPFAREKTPRHCAIQLAGVISPRHMAVSTTAHAPWSARPVPSAR